MGKSLSIITIATSIDNINGYQHNKDNEMNFELPETLEHLRPFFRPRKYPFLSPSEIAKINSQIFASKPNIRNLLSQDSSDIQFKWNDIQRVESTGTLNSDNGDTQYSTASSQELSFSDTVDVADMIQNLKAEATQNIAPESVKDLESFLDLFQEQFHLYQNKQFYTIASLKLKYRQLKFHKGMLELIRRIIEQYDVAEYQDLIKFLAEIVFNTKQKNQLVLTSVNEKLLFTLEQIENDMLILHPNDEICRWFYVKLMEDARKMKLLPTENEITKGEYISLNKKYSTMDRLEIGIMILDEHSEFVQDAKESIWDGTDSEQFALYARYIMDLCQNEKQYPYLTNNYMIKFKYLLKVLKNGQYDLSKFRLKQSGKSLDPQQDNNYDQNLKISEFFQNALVEFYNHEDEIDDAKDHAKSMGMLLKRNIAINSLLNVNDEGVALEIQQFYIGDV